jgi:hypothetical protein
VILPFRPRYSMERRLTASASVAFLSASMASEKIRSIVFSTMLTLFYWMIAIPLSRRGGTMWMVACTVDIGGGQREIPAGTARAGTGKKGTKVHLSMAYFPTVRRELHVLRGQRRNPGKT